MTMTDTPTVTPPAPKAAKPKRKMQRKRAATPVAVEPGSKLAGITPRDCPMACTAKACVISARDVCAHPYKGGLHSSMQTPDAMRRLKEAVRVLGKQKIDLSNT